MEPLTVEGTARDIYDGISDRCRRNGTVYSEEIIDDIRENRPWVLCSSATQSVLSEVAANLLHDFDLLYTESIKKVYKDIGKKV
jgi:hypothetical protein